MPATEDLGVQLEAGIDPAGDTKEQLIRAAEHLFAREGLDGTQIRQINQLAGQRNPSAVHYHFGSKQGLIETILLRHQSEVEVDAAQRLDQFESSGGAVSVRDLVEAMVRPLAAKLDSAPGRDFLRIVPQFIGSLDTNLRVGVARPVTEQSGRLLGLLEASMHHLPEGLRRERLVAYTLVLTSILAERARHLEARRPTPLDSEQFVVHLLDLIEAVLVAPSQVSVGTPWRAATLVTNEGGLS